MGVFGTILTLLVAASVYRMTRHLSGRFWPGCLIATVACSVFLFTMCPRPVYFSMILYAAELTLILEAKRTGDVRPLNWLPLIFLLWANLHIQFVYGLAVLGLFFCATAVRRLFFARQNSFENGASGPSAVSLGLITAGAFVASLINPYSYHLYEIVYQYAHAKVPYRMIRELQPFALLTPSHYLQMLLTGAAFVALAWKKQLDPFKAALLLFATVIGYRTMRDSWFICITAAACLADSMARSEKEEVESPYEWIALASALALSGMLFAGPTNFNRQGLDATVSRIFPVDAVNFLRRHPQPGPLYNSLDWGGFLIWYMPDSPVAIDGRTDLYGDEILARFVVSGGGDPSYLTDPYLNQSGAVLLERQMPLVQALQNDPRFREVYEDRLAVVFARQSAQ